MSFCKCPSDHLRRTCSNAVDLNYSSNRYCNPMGLFLQEFRIKFSSMSIYGNGMLKTCLQQMSVGLELNSWPDFLMAQTCFN